MSLGPPSAGHDGVPSETSFAFAGLTIEPASRNGMSAAAQAVGASVRTRLGHGPRAKAHVDYGAWSRGRLSGVSSRSRLSDGSAVHASPSRRDARRDLLTRDSHAYDTKGADGVDHDKSAFVNGALVSDLLPLLDALGGAHPHPAVTLLKRCVASHEDAHGAGGTWSLVLGTALCGAADRLRETHDMDPRSILDAFQEVTSLICDKVVPALAAPASAVVAESSDKNKNALDAAVAEARALIRPELEPGTLSRDDARALAALVIGLDRGRHPGDAPLALAAALVLARRRARDGDDETSDDVSIQKNIAKESAFASSPVAPNRLLLDHRDAAVGVVTPGPCASKSFVAKGAVLLCDDPVCGFRSFEAERAFAEATTGEENERFDFALLLDDEALREEDVDDVAEAVIRCVSSNDSSNDSSTDRSTTRLVLFRSEAASEARVADVAAALRRKQKNKQSREIVAVVGPGVKKTTLRALARTIGGSVVLDARAVETGDLARSVRVSSAAAGWNPDDTANPVSTRYAKNGFFGGGSDAPRRFAIISGTRPRNATPAASLVLFDRTEAAANARAAEFRRTVRRVSHALADDGAEKSFFQRLVSEDASFAKRRATKKHDGPSSRENEDVIRDDGEPIPRVGRVLPGGGCFELAAAAAVTRAARAARARAVERARALDAEEEETHYSYDAEEAAVSFQAETRRAVIEKEMDRATAFEAFAECLRDVFRVASQNGGARFEDAVARGARAEAAFAEEFSHSFVSEEEALVDDFFDDEKKKNAPPPRVRLSVWRVAWAALADGETPGDEKKAFPKLEESRARVAGLHTAMGVARCVVAAGPIVTRGA